MNSIFEDDFHICVLNSQLFHLAVVENVQVRQQGQNYSKSEYSFGILKEQQTPFHCNENRTEARKRRESQSRSRLNDVVIPRKTSVEDN